MAIDPTNIKRVQRGELDATAEWLLGVPSVVRSVPLDHAGRRDLQQLLDATRIAQQSLDGFVTRLGLAATAVEGSGQPPQEFLRGRARSIRSGTARRDAERVATAQHLSAFTDAAAGGHIGGDQLDSLARAAKRLDAEQREALNTPALVTAAQNLPADEFDVHVRQAAERAKADHGLSEALAARKNSSFKHWFDSRAHMGRFSGQLDPERYELLHTAIDAAVSDLARNAEEPTYKDHNLAAEALVTLVTGSGRPSGSGRPEVTVIVDEQTLRFGPHHQSIRQTGNGHSVPPETVDRLMCDAVLRRVVLDQRGVPINVGRRYRTATGPQWTAIKAVHSTCAWDGCDRPISWCQLHHIHEWEHGGPTDLDNLLPLCSRHHHQVHEGRWSVKLLDDRMLKIYRPDGTLWSTAPTPTRRAPPAPAVANGPSP